MDDYNDEWYGLYRFIGISKPRSESGGGASLFVGRYLDEAAEGAGTRVLLAGGRSLLTVASGRSQSGLLDQL